MKDLDLNIKVIKYEYQTEFEGTWNVKPYKEWLEEKLIQARDIREILIAYEIKMHSSSDANAETMVDSYLSTKLNKMSFNNHDGGDPNAVRYVKGFDVSKNNEKFIGKKLSDFTEMNNEVINTNNPLQKLKEKTMTPFIANLKKFRKIEGFSQYTFGEFIETNPKNIGAYEEGRAEPSIEQYLLICKVLHQDPKLFYNTYL